jgi:hypothetical protein
MFSVIRRKPEPGRTGRFSAWKSPETRCAGSAFGGRIATARVLAALIATVCLLAAPGRARADLTDGLIGYWPFDRHGADYSGLGNDLDLYGGVGFAHGLFEAGLNLHHDGTQFAERPVDDPIYNFGANDFTIQIWVNFNTMDGEQTLVEKFEGIGGPGWTVTKLASNAWHFWASPSAVLYSDPVSIPTGVWLQVIVRRTGDLFELFYDGMLVASGVNENPVPDTDFPLLVGRRNAAGQVFPVDGRIDEVAIWLRALDDTELDFLWNAGDGNPVIPGP